ncbi:MAG: sensor domain-containing diguanylate cyclase [bacterium]
MTSDARDPLNVLLELTRVLAGENSLEEALQAVTEAVLELVPGNHASIRMLDENQGELLCGARSGAGQERRPLTFSRGEGVVGWVAEHGVVARIDDADADSRFKQSADQGFDIGAILAIPLLAGREVVGVLAVTAPEKGGFSDQHELLARLLANCAVQPLERARLERLAVTDHHTLAFNRRVLYPKLRVEMERSRRYDIPLSVLLMDLDHFKGVNDTHGHAVGDVVLRVFADRVRNAVRRPDVLVRRGGEEFVLIMPHTNTEQCRVVAERIRECVQADPAYALGDRSVRQTVSIGLATFDGRENARELERRADEAMYRAKERGRDCVVAADDPE